MSFLFPSIVISSIIGVIIIAWIRSFDIYEKETFNAMLLAYLYLIMYQTLRVVQYTNILSPFRLEVINEVLLTRFRKRSFFSGSMMRRLFEYRWRTGRIRQ